MSKTSIKERNKAIRLAWEREQALVAEYPEYQGDPDNIQFLTREEHLETHKGSWQNPTNWYYNPKTKEFIDFGDDKPIPCEVLNLSEPARRPAIEVQESSNDKGGAGRSEAKKPAEQSSRPSQPEKTASTSPKRAAVTPPEVHESFGEKVLHVVEAVKEFGERHPIIAGIVKWGGAAAIAIGTAAAANSGKGSGSGSRPSSSDDYFSTSSPDDDYLDSSDMDDYDESPSERDYPDERSSPREHNVSGYDRQQNGKTVHVNPYKRGGKHDDD